LVQQLQMTMLTGTSPHLETYGGLILSNNNQTQSATVNVSLVFRFQPMFYKTYNKNKLTVYNLWGKSAIILDPILGDYGFPGYDAAVIGEKKAIDPITNQYVTLS